MNNTTAARADALFMSHLQCSSRFDVADVHAHIAAALRRLGARGCAASVAAEFGDHPETAVARMGWARRTVAAAYPPAVIAPAPVLALAS
jgi:hypothetical protein